MFFSFLKKIFFEEKKRKYSVGYFTLSIPESTTIDILKLLYRSKMEEMPHSSTFEILIDLLRHNVTDKKIISDRFFYFDDIADADVASENLNSILFSEHGIYPFVTKKIVKDRKAFSDQGEVYICIIVAIKDISINGIKTKEDLDKLLGNLHSKPYFNSDILTFSLRFRACDDERTRNIEDQIIELKLNEI